MGYVVLVETIKNGIYFAIMSAGGLLIFTFSDGNDFLFYLGWIVTVIPMVVCLLTLLTTGLAFLTLPITLPLYFHKGTDKSDKFFLDLSSLLSVLANLGIALYGYQILTQFGSIDLPIFEPFDIKFSVKNFSY